MKPDDPNFEQALRLAADGWHGTQFIPLHGRRGVGVDCANLVYCVLRDAGVNLPDVGAPTFGFSPDSNYLQDLEGFCERLPFLPPTILPILTGDVLVFQVSAVRQHMGLALSPNLMLHTWPSRGVIESDLRQSRWQNRLVSLFRLTHNDQGTTHK